MQSGEDEKLEAFNILLIVKLQAVIIVLSEAVIIRSLITVNQHFLHYPTLVRTFHTFLLLSRAALRK